MMQPNHSTDWEGPPPQSGFQGKRRIFATKNDDRNISPRGSMNPPVNVVVIRGTPDSKPISDGGGFTLTAPAQNLIGAFSDEIKPKSDGDRPGSFSLSSSSFKLMPRHGVPAMCSPSPSLRGQMSIGNRKRRARSISSPSSCSEEDHEDSPMSAMDKEDFSSPRHSPPSTPSTGTEGNMLRLDGLSINSPLASRCLKDEMILSPARKPPSQNSWRPGPSSFSLYSFSPIGSVLRNNSGSLSGSAGSMVNARTPCSSTKSSPRHVPLTVLSSSSQQGPSPMMQLPPAGRPPFHSGISKMLHSLDGREDHEEISPSRRTSTKLLLFDPIATTTPGAVDTSWDMSEDTCTPRNWDKHNGTSLPEASPRTPLPRVALTPRTPLSARCNPNAVLPVFPGPEGLYRTTYAPSDNAAVGLQVDDPLEVFTRHPPHSSPPSPTPRNHPSLVFNLDSSYSLAMSAETSPKLGATPPALRCNDSPPTFVVFNNSPAQSGKHCTPLQTTNLAGGAWCTELSSPEARGIKTRSVMTPSGSDNGFLSAMMRAEARAGILEAETGSLSDSDDDTDFVLSCPLSTSTRLPKVDKMDHQSSLGGNRRVKQRVRCTPNSHEMRAHNSSLSLTSNEASSTSLFGMDIVQEGQSSVPRASVLSFPLPSYKVKSLGSSNVLRRRDGEYGSSGSLHRRKSEVSLGSLGLSVEGPNNGDSGRDLITPPIVRHCAISPPPLMKRPVDCSEKCISNFSLCVTSADKRSVDQVIYPMAFQDQQ